MLMIPAVGANRFGQFLKEARESTIDPATGRRFTQKRLADLIGVSSSKVAAWERADILFASPQDVAALTRVLPVSEAQLVEAMGYEVGPATLRPSERELLAHFQRLSPGLQEAALRVVRALPEPRPHELPRSSPTGSPVAGGLSAPAAGGGRRA